LGRKKTGDFPSIERNDARRGTKNKENTIEE
jgi:hypothetical protein